MALETGVNSIRKNVNELMGPILSESRKRAIFTLAKKHGISFQEAQARQALAISKTLARRS